MTATSIRKLSRMDWDMVKEYTLKPLRTQRMASNDTLQRAQLKRQYRCQRNIYLVRRGVKE